jgi:hypothetical protein
MPDIMSSLQEALMGVGSKALGAFESIDKFAKKSPFFQRLTDALYALGSGSAAMSAAGLLGPSSAEAGEIPQSSFQQALQSQYDPRRMFPEEEEEYTGMQRLVEKGGRELTEMLGSIPPGRLGLSVPAVVGALSPTNLAKLRAVAAKAIGKRHPDVLAEIVRSGKPMPRKFQRGLADITTKSEALQRSIQHGFLTPEEAAKDYATSRGVHEPITRTIGLDPEKMLPSTSLHEGAHNWRNRILNIFQGGIYEGESPKQLPLGRAEKEAKRVYEALYRWYDTHPEDVERISHITDTWLGTPAELFSQSMAELLTTKKGKREFSLLPDYVQHETKKLRRLAR